MSSKIRSKNNSNLLLLIRGIIGILFIGIGLGIITGTTIKIISQDLHDQFKDKKELTKDLELLVNQVERCSQILKRLSLNPGVEDDFIDQECSMFDYVSEIIKSFEDISNKEFISI